MDINIASPVTPVAKQIPDSSTRIAISVTGATPLGIMANQPNMSSLSVCFARHGPIQVSVPLFGHGTAE